MIVKKVIYPWVIKTIKCIVCKELKKEHPITYNSDVKMCETCIDAKLYEIGLKK